MLLKPVRSWNPHSYQSDGIEICVSQAAAGLLMDPGLGKTTTVYAAFKILRDLGYVKRMLVVVPLRPLYNVWPKQKDTWEQFKDLTVRICHGKDKEEMLNSEGDIFCVNPEALEWLTGARKDSKGKLICDPSRLKWLREKFQMLVVDESTKFKDSQTNRFKIMRALVPQFRRRYILTGTPTPQGLEDLFGQMYILDEGAALGRYITHYRNEYFYPSGYGGFDYTPMPDAMERISARIKPLVLRVPYHGNLDLPELWPDDRYLDLPPKLMKMYDAMESSLMAEVAAGRVVAANAAVASSKCRQIIQGGLYTRDVPGADDYEILHDVKLKALEDFLEEMSGQPVLIPYQFNFDRDQIRDKLKIPCIGASPKKDAALIEAFSQGKLPALAGHPESISLGVDGLQDSCSHIFWYGLPWNLLHYSQTIDRVRRQGSTSDHVINHRLIMRDTLDERVLAVLGVKGATQDQLLGLLMP